MVATPRAEKWVLPRHVPVDRVDRLPCPCLPRWTGWQTIGHALHRCLTRKGAAPYPILFLLLANPEVTRKEERKKIQIRGSHYYSNLTSQCICHAIFKQSQKNMKKKVGMLDKVNQRN